MMSLLLYRFPFTLLSCSIAVSGSGSVSCSHSRSYSGFRFPAFPDALPYEPVKNLRYNIYCFDVMLNFSKIMPTMHTSMTSTF